MNRYMINFVCRLTIFITVFAFYISRKEMLIDILTHKFMFGIDNYGITFVHVVWAFFMVMMIRHLLPAKTLSMALRKNEEENYVEVEGYSELELAKFIQDQNVKAWTVMLLWLSFNAIWGALYLFGVLDVADLLMLTVFYFLSDYIWGHFMMFTPMLYIQNFFSWSLFFTSLVVLIRWEIVYAKNPKRFWSGSNKTLQCANCKDKTCQIKKRLSRQR